MANRVRPIVVSEADRAELERLQRPRRQPAGLSRRVRAVLLMAQGLSGVEIAERVGLHGGAGEPDSAALRRERGGGVARPPEIGPAADDHRAQARADRRPDPQAAAAGADALDHPGPGATRPGCRIRRCIGSGRAHALQPHRVTTFKFTTDPAAEEKISRRGRPVSEPADECGRVESGREDADPGPEPHPAAAAVAAGAAGAANPRLPAQRIDQSVRGPGGGHGHGAGRVPPRATPGPTFWRFSSAWRARIGAASCTSSSTIRPRTRRPPCRRG